MGLGDIFKKVVLPAAGSYFLGPMAGTGLQSLGFTGKLASSPMIQNALASGLGSMVMGGKPKDALKAALLGGIGGTALQERFPRTNVPTTAGTTAASSAPQIGVGSFTSGSDVNIGGGNKATIPSAPAAKAVEAKTLSGDLLKGLGVKDENILFKIFNSPIGEGLGAGLIAQLLSSLTNKDVDERGGFEQRPWGEGGPGGQIGGLPGFAMGGPAMPQQIRKPGFPRRDGAIMPYEGGGRVDDVPAMLTAGEFVLTKDAVKGLGGGNQNLGIQRAYDMMGDLEGMA